MSEASAPISYSLTDAEAATLSKLTWSRHWSRSSVDYAGSWPLLYGVILMGVLVVLACSLGLVAKAAWSPAFIFAEAGLFVGWFAERWLRRRVPRQLAREQARSMQRRGAERSVGLSPDGLHYETPLTQVRYRFKAIKGISEESGLVMVWLDGGSVVGLPLRVFANDAAKAAFVAELEQRRSATEAGDNSAPSPA